MLLTKSGVTVDVSHPSDIKRYKGLGYVEEKQPEQKNAEAAETPTPKKARGKQEPAQKPDEGGEA